MLTPEGESGSNKNNSMFHRLVLVLKVGFGLKSILSNWNR
jgi:hypothetical protein